MKMTDESALLAIVHAIDDLHEACATTVELRRARDYLRARLAADQQKANIPDLSNWAQHYSVNETAVQALRSILGDQQKGGGEVVSHEMLDKAEADLNAKDEFGSLYVSEETYRYATALIGWMRDRTPQPSIPAPAQQGHRWSTDGETCLDCGDKDWMNDPVCKPSGPAKKCGTPEGGSITHAANETCRMCETPAQQDGKASGGEDYYIQDTRQYVGNCPMWWGPDRKGYTAHLSRAGRYSRDDAMRQAASRETDRAWPCAAIDSIASLMVDMQDMRKLPEATTKDQQP